MTLYKDWAPTQFDQAGAFLDNDRQDWIVAPVCITRDTRDSIILANYAAIKATLVAEGIEYETPSFGHWGPGWIEIILAHPNGAKVIEAIKEKLEDYPVLDEDLMAKIEQDHEFEDWESWASYDWRKLLTKTFPDREEQIDAMTKDDLYTIWHEASDHCSWTTEHDSEGTRFNLEGALPFVAFK